MIITLSNIDPLDFIDFINKVEHSLNIKFEDTELMYIKTFGELCDHITNKIKLINDEQCTTQQAFYKLRSSFYKLQLDSKTITPDTLLLDLLPRSNRLSKTREIEKQLGFKLDILRPPRFVTILLILTLVTSLIELFFNWKIGLVAFFLSLIGLWVAKKVGKELDLKTFGELSEKMTNENYLKSRRNAKTFNKREIENILKGLFSEQLGFEKSELTNETKFV